MGDKNSLKVQPNAVPALTQKNKFVAKGDNCIQAGQVDKIEVNVQGLTTEQLALLLQLRESANQQHSETPRCTPNELAELNHNYYHLFVLEKEFYDKGVFSVGKTVTLEYTEEDIWERYYSFDAAVIQELLGMPAILATKNRQQGRTDDGHTFRVAKIDKITDQGETFCIEFRTDENDRKQQLLNEHCEELGIATAFLRTELDEIHWAIKEGNLLGILNELGI